MQINFTRIENTISPRLEVLFRESVKGSVQGSLEFKDEKR